MLVRNPKKLVRPGQWVLAKIDPTCWVKTHSYDFRHHDVAWICITSRYGPRYDTRNYFEHYYSVSWRFPRTEPVAEGEREYFSHDSEYRFRNTEGDPDTLYKENSYCKANTWDFGLLGVNGSGMPQYDETEHAKERDGKAGFLYVPASDDPDECPGGDYSLYFCDHCNRFVVPHSDDSGTLRCPMCDYVGLMMQNEKVCDYLEGVREKAHAMGIGRDLERKIGQLYNMTFTCTRDDEGFDRKLEQTRRVIIGKDFAPLSFDWALYRPPVQSGKDRTFVMNGGLIYHGPTCPGDGSSPSLTVDMDWSINGRRDSYWGLHT